MSSKEMDDLINLINSTTLSAKKPPTKPAVVKPLHNNQPDASDTNSDDDDDISYLLDVMNKNPPSNINGTVSSHKDNGKQHHTSTALPSLPPQPPSTPPIPANNPLTASLDDLVSLLSPTHNTNKPIATQPDLELPAANEPPSQTKQSSPSPPAKSTLSLSIRTLTGETMHYEMEPLDTVKSLKLKIFNEHKIWPQHQRLVYGGDNLTDKHTLQMLGIQNEGILYMVLTTICSNTEPPKTIAVQKLNNDIFYISCTSNDTVQTLKRTISNQEGYEIESQILYFMHYGRLENNKTLSQYNIQNNSMLKLMLRNIRFDNIKDEEEEDDDDEDEEDQQVTLPVFSPQHDPQKDNKPLPVLPQDNKAIDVKQGIVPPKINIVPPNINEPQANVVPLNDATQHLLPPNPPAPPVQKPEAKVTNDDTLEPKQEITAPSAPDIAPSEPKKPIPPPPQPKQPIPPPPEPKPPMVHKIIERTSYNGWNIGDICYRKGVKCVIKGIDFRTVPPSLTVSLCDDPKHEINTEFRLISRTAPIVKKPPPTKSRSTSSSSSPQRVKRKGPKKIHLCSPNIIRQLMAVNNIKYVGGGLKNLGNSCFMNATLQCLSYTQVFQNYIYQNIHSKMCSARAQNEVCFMCELHGLLPKIINNGGNVCSPSRLFNHLQYLSASLVPGRQEDAHEFWTALVKHLQASVMKPHISANGGKKLPIAIQETSIIYKIWGGYLRSQILCTSCNKGSNTYDSILDLSLEIRGCSSVIAALKKFTVEEKLVNDNKYFCAFCNKKQNAIKQLTIFDAPNILILHLKRFEFGTKIDKFVKFETSLDLTPFMSQYKKYRDRKTKITYSLYAVLIHSGKYSNCGHYYSYIRTASNKWYLCNDSTIRSSNVGNVLKQNGYLFFYQRNQPKRYPTY